MSRRQSQASDLFCFSPDGQSSQQYSMAPPPPQSVLFPSSHAIGSNPIALCSLPLDPPHRTSLKSSPSSIYRHHRHHSNASEASSSSPFPDRSFCDHVSVSNPPAISPAPSFEDLSTSSPFVDEPLPMEGEFATMDLHSSSPNMISNFLSRPSSNAVIDDRQHFRYDTLTWAKEHPLPEPQDMILATGGLHPKTSISSLTAMLESHQNPPDPSNPSFHSHPLHLHQSNSSSSSSSSSSGASHPPPHPQINSFPLDPLVSHNPSDPSYSPGSDASSNNHHSSTAPNDDTRLPIISLSSLTSNPNSPLPRLDMNHPAMPTGPSISLTSATPLTAKPGQQLPNFFDSINESTSLAGPNQNLEPSSSKNVFESLIPHPLLTSLQSANQSSTFLNPRPLRGRQRSKSESMGKHHHSTSMNSGPNLLSPKSLFLNPPTCPPPATEFSPISLCSSTSSATLLPYVSSEFWSAQHNITHASLLTSSRLCPSEGQVQTLQNITEDTSFLQGLLENFDRKARRPGGPDYDVSFLKPSLHPNSRRSHSVSHGHRRGRSEGHIEAFSSPADHPSSVQNFLSIPSDLPSSVSSSSSPSTRAYPTSSHDSTAITQHPPTDSQRNVNSSDSDWLTSFSIDGPSVTYNPNEPWSQQAYPSSPSDACLSSTRPRSYSHSSFESEDTGPSEPPVALPIEYRSRTTAATKAAAVKRRKEGVAARYICEMCGETFTRRYNLRGHQRAHKGEKPFACGFPGCTSRFARAHDQKRHYKLHLGVKDYNCPVCRKTFIRLDALQRHHKSDAGQACFHQLQMSGRLSQDYGGLQSNVGNYPNGSSASLPHQSSQNSESRPSLTSDTAPIKEEPGIHSDPSYQAQLVQSSQHLNGNDNGMGEGARLDGSGAEGCDIPNHLFAQFNHQQNPQSLQFLNPHHREL